jgi:hypothetical protein
LIMHEHLSLFRSLMFISAHSVISSVVLLIKLETSVLILSLIRTKSFWEE